MTQINVLSSNAIKVAYLEIQPQFEKASGHNVTTTWAGTNDILKRMKANETYDLMIMARHDHEVVGFVCLHAFEDVIGAGPGGRHVVAAGLLELRLDFEIGDLDGVRAQDIDLGHWTTLLSAIE